MDRPAVLPMAEPPIFTVTTPFRLLCFYTFQRTQSNNGTVYAEWIKTLGSLTSATKQNMTI